MNSFQPVDVAATLRSLSLENTNLKKREVERDLHDTAREAEWNSRYTARNAGWDSRDTAHEAEVRELKKQVKALQKSNESLDI
jgi:hypothetical protein